MKDNLETVPDDPTPSVNNQYERITQSLLEVNERLDRIEGRVSEVIRRIG